MAKPLKSHGKDYTMDMLLRVLGAQQLMVEALDNDRMDKRATASACHREIRLSARWATKAIADLAGVRWAEDDIKLVEEKGWEGLEALATRYGCRSLLGPPPTVGIELT
jgi:hypothetical protein